MLIDIQRKPVEVVDFETHIQAHIPDKVVLRQIVTSTYLFPDGSSKPFERTREMNLVLQNKTTIEEMKRVYNGKYNIIRMLSYEPIITAFETEMIESHTALHCYDDIALKQLVMSDHDPEIPVVHRNNLMYKKYVLGALTDEDIDMRDPKHSYICHKYDKAVGESVSFI